MTDALTEIACWGLEAEAERELLASVAEWVADGYGGDLAPLLSIMARAQGFDRGFPIGSRYAKAAAETLAGLSAGDVDTWAAFMDGFRQRHEGSEAFLRLRSLSPIAAGVDGRLAFGAGGARLSGPAADALLREAKRRHPGCGDRAAFLVVLDKRSLSSARIVRLGR